MLYELRTYTLRAGSQPIVAKNSGEVGRDIRGDNYGRLEGYWMTEIGPLNQVMHLWSYESFDERIRLRTELGKNRRWREEYLPLIRPHLLRQDIRLLECVRPLQSVSDTGNIYEYRNYRTQPGKAREWANLITEAMPVRERHSKNIGVFITEAGQPNEVSHLWVYKDLNDRMQCRAAANADPDWRAFLKQSGPMLDEMHSTILVPAAHSPLR
ncbi:MAG: NIPSNAP family protein [Gammaproteobacteria bacterium]|nr:NIPSNAP family protein [Gammaproteobacteria bacterium]